MKTKNNTLDFRKHTVSELNHVDLNKIKGGWTTASITTNLTTNLTTITDFSKDTLCTSDNQQQ